MGSVLKFVLELLLSILSLAFFIFILFPGIIAISLPLYLFRFILICYAKCFRPDFVGIMSGTSPFLALDDLHDRPLCTIVGMGAFDTSDAEGCKDFAKNSVYAINPDTNKPLHPESRQYYEKWAGFFWWKWEENFDINEHLSVWKSEDEKIVSEEELIAIVGILESQPFAKKKSPWECVLVRNVLLRNVRNPQSPKTIVMFRFHHGFADGVAMMQMFMRCVFTDSFDKVAKPAFVRRSACGQLAFGLGAALQLPYHFFKQGLTALDLNDWHLPEKRLTRKIHKAWSSRLSTQMIKDIKTCQNVGFTAVLLSAVCGGLRKGMIRCGVRVPRKMHALVPLPWPGHPAGLSNHWSYGFVELPLRISDPAKRLQKLHSHIQGLKRSGIPAVNFVLLKFAALLPTWLLKHLNLANYLPSVILSNFPGPPGGSEGLGRAPLVDCMFTGGPLRGNIGISMTMLSYEGGLRLVTGIDSAILPTQQQTKELMNDIEAEFQIMKSLQIANVV